jgi:spermidine synthase
MVDRRLQRIIYICFLISGAAGLIYEVVWARQLSLFLGITTYANTAVITAYMAGLAAGSLVIGRLADRHRDSLRLYAWLEVGVGLYAATTPWLLTWMHAAYAGAAGSLGVTGTVSHLLRFALALLLLLVPTFLMGGTLPLLVRGLTSSFPDLAGVTGRLYGINTLGATLGTWAAGYLLLPGFGVRSTIFLGVLMNLGVAAAILALRRRIAPAEIATGKDDKPPSPGKRVRRTAPEVDVLSPAVARALLIGFTISGFGALVYEIAWIRALTLIIGSSVYAFSTTLTTYLAGIALGSLLYARYLAGGEGRRPAKTAGHRPSTGSSYRLAQAAVLEVGIGLSAALGLPLIGLLPGLFLRGYQAGLHESFPLFQAFIFGRRCFWGRSFPSSPPCGPGTRQPWDGGWVQPTPPTPAAPSWGRCWGGCSCSGRRIARGRGGSLLADAPGTAQRTAALWGRNCRAPALWPDCLARSTLGSGSHDQWRICQRPAACRPPTGPDSERAGP